LRILSREACEARAIPYGVWLAWLDAQGELDRLASPESHVTTERVRAYLDI